MARVKGGVVSRKRRKRVLKLAKGYYVQNTSCSVLQKNK